MENLAFCLENTNKRKKKSKKKNGRSFPQGRNSVFCTCLTSTGKIRIENETVRIRSCCLLAKYKTDVKEVKKKKAVVSPKGETLVFGVARRQRKKVQTEEESIDTYEKSVFACKAQTHIKKVKKKIGRSFPQGRNPVLLLLPDVNGKKPNRRGNNKHL